MAYRSIMHYFFKEDMVDEGCEFLENTFVQSGMDKGCYHLEFIQDESDPYHFIGMGIWENLEDSRSFSALYQQHQDELMMYCKEMPKREFYQIKKTWGWKAEKAA